MPSGIYNRASTISRFLSKIKNVNGCWEWQANKLPQGYGIFWYRNKGWRANRAAPPKLLLKQWMVSPSTISDIIHGRTWKHVIVGE